MRSIVLTALVLAVAAPAAAAAQPNLWATVNVCDTAAHPEEIGVRASMPRSSARTTLYVRFRVQYRDATDGRWHHVAGADSSWRSMGHGRARPVESGWSFKLSGGKPQLLRGSVRFQWRRGGHVVKRALRLTTGGHRSTAGADPAEFSSASCEIE